MAGGALAETHANRRTDYAMIGDLEADLANAPDYATFLDRMEAVFVELHRVLRDRRYALVIVRDAYQDGRYVFTGSDLAARAARVGFVPRAISSGTRPARGCGRTAIRGSSSRTSSTSTSWCSARSRPGVRPRGAREAR